MIAPDDPRLTAYALGELSGEERAAFERLLSEDARAQAEVAAIAETGARLSRELRPASGLALSERRRASLRKTLAATTTASNQTAEQTAADDQASIARLRPRRLRSWALLAAIVPALGAAVLLFRSANAPPAPDNGEFDLVGMAPNNLVPEAPKDDPTDPGKDEDDGLSNARQDALREATNGSPIGMLAQERAREPQVRRRIDQEFEGQAWGSEEGETRGQGLGLSGVGEGGPGRAVALRAGDRALARRGAPISAGSGPRILPLPEPMDGIGGFNREAYDALEENPFVQVLADPRSTFSIDVDTAAYALVRRFLQNGQLPPRGAVRIEELINYFSYRYPQPQGDAPVSVVTNVAPAPWNAEHQLLRVALQARHVAQAARPAANLVFLIDVSGSMEAANRIGLVKYGLKQLTQTLESKDRVSIVTYAGNSGMVLSPTPGSRRTEIAEAIDRLEAGGSTNGGEGITLAYSLARKHFEAGRVNRVILATDGDFNVGVTSQSELVELVQRQAKSGVFLSVLGFGEGNYQDSMLEKLADKGNGNYAYIDEPAEAKKVLVEQATGTLLTLAKDVKLQLEFNPTEVAGYRLIGYENRKLAHQDFNDDTKDAGEIGADHSVTALYELIPAGGAVPAAGVDPLKYQPPAAPAPVLQSSLTQGELLNVTLRYQPPGGGASRLIEQAVRGPAQPLDADFRFAAAVAEFGMLLRGSEHRGQASYEQVLELAKSALGEGKERTLREAFVELVRKAQRLAKAEKSTPVVDPLDGKLP